MCEQEKKISDALNMGEWVGTEWLENYYEFLLDLCELDEEDGYMNDLDWFIFETDFGRKKDYTAMYDTYTGKTWRINSPEILYDYITREYQETMQKSDEQSLF